MYKEQIKTNALMILLLRWHLKEILVITSIEFVKIFFLEQPCVFFLLKNYILNLKLNFKSVSSHAHF